MIIPGSQWQPLDCRYETSFLSEYLEMLWYECHSMHHIVDGMFHLLTTDAAVAKPEYGVLSIPVAGHHIVDLWVGANIFTSCV